MSDYFDAEPSAESVKSPPWDPGASFEAEPSPEFRHFLEKNESEVLAVFPELLRAVPPVALERRNGSWSLNPAKLFEELAQSARDGTFRLRCPEENTEVLVGPFRAHGGCLEPLTQEGCLYWFDPTIAAQDGDLVLVQFTPETMGGIVSRGSRKPEWVERYTTMPSQFCTKLLKAVGSLYMLVTNDSCVHLGRNKILGVLRRIVRNGSPIHAGIPTLTNVGPNAATEVYTDVVSSVAATAGNLAVVSRAVIEPGTYELTITTRLKCASFVTPDDVLISVAEVGAGGGSFTTPSYQPHRVTALNQYITVTFSTTYTTSTGSAWQFNAGFTDAGGGNTFSAEDFSLRTTAIKR